MAMKTIEMRAAAAVTVRPVRSSPVATRRCWPPPCGQNGPNFLDPGEQEDLVVHGQTEGDAEHEDGHAGVQYLVALMTQQTGQMPGDRHHRPERRADSENMFSMRASTG